MAASFRHKEEKIALKTLSPTLVLTPDAFICPAEVKEITTERNIFLSSLYLDSPPTYDYNEKYKTQLAALCGHFYTIAESYEMKEENLNYIINFPNYLYGLIDANPTIVIFSDIKKLLEKFIYLLQKKPVFSVDMLSETAKKKLKAEELKAQSELNQKAAEDLVIRKKSILETLLPFLQVCDTGIGTHLNLACQQLVGRNTLHDLWCDERTEIVRKFALQHINKNKILSGDEIHVYQVLDNFSRKQKWNIRSDLGHVEDHFSSVTKITPDVLEQAKIYFANHYNLRCMSEIFSKKFEELFFQKYRLPYPGKEEKEKDQRTEWVPYKSEIIEQAEDILKEWNFDNEFLASKLFDSKENEDKGSDLRFLPKRIQQVFLQYCQQKNRFVSKDCWKEESDIFSRYRLIHANSFEFSDLFWIEDNEECKITSFSELPADEKIRYFMYSLIHFNTVDCFNLLTPSPGLFEVFNEKEKWIALAHALEKHDCLDQHVALFKTIFRERPHYFTMLLEGISAKKIPELLDLSEIDFYWLHPRHELHKTANQLPQIADDETLSNYMTFDRLASSRAQLEKFQNEHKLDPKALPIPYSELLRLSSTKGSDSKEGQYVFKLYLQHYFPDYFQKVFFEEKPDYIKAFKKAHEQDALQFDERMQELQKHARDGNLKKLQEMRTSTKEATILALWMQRCQQHDLLKYYYSLTIESTTQTPELQLYYAILFNQKEHFTILLSARDFDSKYRSSKGESLLFIAAKHGHLDIVRALFERGADINAVASDTSTPLYIAAKHNHIHIVNFFLEKLQLSSLSIYRRLDLQLQVNTIYSELLSVPVNQLNIRLIKTLKPTVPLPKTIKTGEKSLFHQAVLGNHVDLIQYFLRENSCKVFSDYTDQELGESFLHLINQGQYTLAKQLLEKRPNLDKSCKTIEDKATVLHLCMRKEKPADSKLISILYSENSIATKEDSKECTPLLLAVENERWEIVSEVFNRFDILNQHSLPQLKKIFKRLTDKPQIDFISLLLEKKPELQLSAEELCFELLTASKVNIELIKILKPAALPRRTEENNVFHQAIRHNHFEIVKYFLDFESKEETFPTHTDHELGESFLHLVNKGQYALAKQLLVKRPNLNKGWDFIDNKATALHLCMRKENPADSKLILMLCVENAAGKEDSKSCTPLLLAVENERWEIVSEIVNRLDILNQHSIPQLKKILKQLVDKSQIDFISLLLKQKPDLQLSAEEVCFELLSASKLNKKLIETLTPASVPKQAGGKSVFQQAICCNHFDIVEYFLAFESKEEKTTKVLPGHSDHELGESLLYLVNKGQYALAKQLLEKKPNLNKSWDFIDSKATALHLCMRKENPADSKLILMLCVENAAGKEDSKGCTPLLLAVENEHWEIVSEIINHLDILNQHTLPQLKKVLKQLADKSQIDFILLLLKQKPNLQVLAEEICFELLSAPKVNIKSIKTLKPASFPKINVFHQAIRHDHFEIVEYFLDLENKEEKTTKVLPDHSDYELGESLLCLVNKGQYALANQLLEKRPTIEKGWSFSQTTALHLCMRKENPADSKLILMLCVENAAGKEDSNGCTPLLLAVENERWEIVSEIVNRLDILNQHSIPQLKKILKQLADKSQIDFIALLLKQKPDLQLSAEEVCFELLSASKLNKKLIETLTPASVPKQTGGKSVFQQAICCNHFEIVEYFLAFENKEEKTTKVLPGHSDHELGESLLHLVNKGQYALAKQLLKKRPNLDKSWDFNKTTSLHLCMRKENPADSQFILMLCAENSAIVKEDSQGFIPLLLAIENEHWEIVSAIFNRPDILDQHNLKQLDNILKAIARKKQFALISLLREKNFQKALFALISDDNVAIEIVKQFQPRGYALSAEKIQNNTLFHQAILNEHFQVVEYFLTLESKESVLSRYTGYDLGPSLVALIDNDRYDLAEQLIEKRPDVEKDWGYDVKGGRVNALHLCMRTPNTASIKLILMLYDQNPIAAKEDNNRYTPLLLAIENNHWSIVSEIVKRPDILDQHTPVQLDKMLKILQKRGKYDLMPALLVPKKPEFQETIKSILNELIFCLQREREDKKLIIALLSALFPEKGKNDFFNRLLQRFFDQGQPDLAIILLSSQPDLVLKAAKSNQSILHYMLQFEIKLPNQFYTPEHLVEENKLGDTPLLSALKSSRTYFVESFLNVTMNCYSRHQLEKVLWLMLKMKKYEYIKILLHKRPDLLNAREKITDNSLMHYLELEEKIDTAFRESIIDLNKEKLFEPNKNGDSILSIVQKKGDVKRVAYLLKNYHPYFGISQINKALQFLMDHPSTLPLIIKEMVEFPRIAESLSEDLLFHLIRFFYRPSQETSIKPSKASFLFTLENAHLKNQRFFLSFVTYLMNFLNRADDIKEFMDDLFKIRNSIPSIDSPSSSLFNKSYFWQEQRISKNWNDIIRVADNRMRKIDSAFSESKRF